MNYSKWTFYKKMFIRLGAVFMGLLVLLIIVDVFLMPLYTRGGAITSVPNVVGMSFDKASKLLTQRKLEAKRGYDYYDAKTAIGNVLSQNPLPESEVKEGRHVYLSINVERDASATVPNVVGKTIEEAKKMLDDAKLEVGDITEQVAKSINEDEKIVWQSVQPSRNVKKKTKMNLRVAKVQIDGGEKAFVIPDVLGVSLNNGLELLKETGFEKIIIEKVYSKKITSNTILEQDPTASELAKISQKITLKVSTESKN